jgi:hypothetical protein
MKYAEGRQPDTVRDEPPAFRPRLQASRRSSGACLHVEADDRHAGERRHLHRERLLVVGHHTPVATTSGP